MCISLSYFFRSAKYIKVVVIALASYSLLVLNTQNILMKLNSNEYHILAMCHE